MIFVGEHTSYTHAWVASALESGIRGSVQLMLGMSSLVPSAIILSTSCLSVLMLSITTIELGLVDEAKAAVDKWMARWIDVVSAHKKTIILAQPGTLE